jgi:hypothetical protein
LCKGEFGEEDRIEKMVENGAILGWERGEKRLLKRAIIG